MWYNDTTEIYTVQYSYYIHLIDITPSTCPLQNEGTCALERMVSEGHFLVPHAGRALAFCRKHFWHSLKKHCVGFKVVFENQSSFFSETSSLNPINIQKLEQAFVYQIVPGKDPHIYIHKNERAFFKERFRVMMGLLWGSCTGIL